LGRIAARRERWREATEQLQRALACENPVVWAHLELAMALRQCGSDKLAAVAELARFARQPPEGLSDGHYGSAAGRA